MNKNFKNGVQAGFTLIELIVVIVILGILAATALPKFVSMGGDARLAALQAAKGSLSSTASMAHGKFLITPSSTTLTVPGVATPLNFAGQSGYPKAETQVADAAGLTVDDYTVLASGADIPTGGTAPLPTVATDTIMVIPKSLAGTAAAATCNLTYSIAAAAAANVEPTITVTGNADACQ